MSTTVPKGPCGSAGNGPRKTIVDVASVRVLWYYNCSFKVMYPDMPKNESRLPKAENNTCLIF
jgi:hypothetical protein